MRTFLQVKGGRVDEVERDVVSEQPLTIYVNGERFVTLLCSPFTDGLSVYAGNAVAVVGAGV